MIKYDPLGLTSETNPETIAGLNHPPNMAGRAGASITNEPNNQAFPARDHINPEPCPLSCRHTPHLSSPGKSMPDALTRAGGATWTTPALLRQSVFRPSCISVHTVSTYCTVGQSTEYVGLIQSDGAGPEGSETTTKSNPALPIQP